MEDVPLALILAIPLGAVAVGFGFVLLKRVSEWLERALAGRWAKGLLRRLKELPDCGDATAEVAGDPPHPVLTVLGVSVAVVQDEAPDSEPRMSDVLLAYAGIATLTLPVVWLRADRQDGDDTLTFQQVIGARPSHKKLAAHIARFADEVSRWDPSADDSLGDRPRGGSQPAFDVSERLSGGVSR